MGRRCGVLVCSVYIGMVCVEDVDRDRTDDGFADFDIDAPEDAVDSALILLYSSTLKS